MHALALTGSQYHNVHHGVFRRVGRSVAILHDRSRRNPPHFLRYVSAPRILSSGSHSRRGCRVRHSDSLRCSGRRLLRPRTLSARHLHLRRRSVHPLRHSDPNHERLSCLCHKHPIEHTKQTWLPARRPAGTLPSAAPARTARAPRAAAARTPSRTSRSRRR